jgi:hypothetical protein
MVLGTESPADVTEQRSSIDDLENISNHVAADLDGGCTNAGVSTSFFCPLVLGVIALNLGGQSQADVKRSPRNSGNDIPRSRHRPADDDTGVMNAAGLWYSNLDGFGIIDAAAAVRAAEIWELYVPEKLLIGESGKSENPNFG